MDMALSLPTSSSSLYPLLLRTQNYFPFKASKFGTICCSGRPIQVNAQRTKRKPRPSFIEQIRDKWSLKVPSRRDKFPWEEQKQGQIQEEVEEEDIEKHQCSGMVSSEAENDSSPSASDDPVSFSASNYSVTAPWIHGVNTKTTFNSYSKNGKNVDRNLDHREENAGYAVVDTEENLKKEVNYKSKFEERDNVESSEKEVNHEVEFKGEDVKFGAVSVELIRDEEVARVRDSKDTVSSNVKHNSGGKREYASIQVPYDDNSSSTELPWKEEKNVESLEGDWRIKKSNTALAERMVPEHELKRLRNVALRMFERIKVGPAGITQDLVDSIHEKWRLDEVVKLKFEEPLSCNMRRTHEISESRTGGLVIWRSGSSMVLYRGMSYKFPCVQSFSKQIVGSKDKMFCPEEDTSNATGNAGVKDLIGATEPFIPDHAKYLKDLSQEELTDFSELDQLLDELGPRFRDWCGREPLPVDADLLPGFDPEYKPPFRLLPYGIKHCLTNKEMTTFRRLARMMPPHFALGRNRELQGLAKAMIKLWERSAIAKIAIKRGVQNTRNERMAEELKVLTGGTLLSRNKEYIVFYRGNDFLPPALMETLKERKKLTYLKQDEEEQARQMVLSSFESNCKTSQGPVLVAGTLTETVAATSRWRNQLGSEDIDKMMRDASLSRRASLIKHLKNKLALAKGKLKKAEKALEKVQGHLEPSEFPTDLETISDEERFLFRKIGLSMKPYLLLGRRGVYDGTIENMHLHWKYRELVKIIVSRKSLPQVRHIAISLEAESGGVLLSVERTTKGYAIIIYRGKNYQRPHVMRPTNLLTKRRALARSIELQRREALKHHISDLQERIELLECNETDSGKKVDVENAFSSIFGNASFSEGDIEEEGEEADLQVYESGNGGTYNHN